MGDKMERAELKKRFDAINKLDDLKTKYAEAVKVLRDAIDGDSNDKIVDWAIEGLYEIIDQYPPDLKFYAAKSAISAAQNSQAVTVELIMGALEYLGCTDNIDKEHEAGLMLDLTPKNTTARNKVMAKIADEVPTTAALGDQLAQSLSSPGLEHPQGF